MIAHQRLAALGDAQHGVDNEGVHIGDDGVAHQTVVSQTPQDDAVEEEDHHAVAQLRYAVGHTDGEEPLVDMPIHFEFHKVEGVVSPQEVAQIDHAGQQLGKSCGKRRAPNAPVQKENGHIVQHAVGQASGDYRQDGDAGIPVGLDEHLHGVGHNEAHRKGRKAPQIVDGVLVGDALRAQKHGEGLQKDEHQYRDGHADARQQHCVLAEQAVGLFALAPA